MLQVLMGTAPRSLTRISRDIPTGRMREATMVWARPACILPLKPSQMSFTLTSLFLWVSVQRVGQVDAVKSNHLCVD